MDLFCCIKDDYAAKILILGNQTTLENWHDQYSGVVVREPGYRRVYMSIRYNFSFV
jgi:hypothetical protein